ncbi:MAG: hypothetical protein R3D44_08440 [Hyphomicrobiaceae bacterium]
MAGSTAIEVSACVFRREPFISALPQDFLANQGTWSRKTQWLLRCGGSDGIRVIKNAVEAVRRGAVAYLSNPTNVDELELELSRIFDNVTLMRNYEFERSRQ